MTPALSMVKARVALEQETFMEVDLPNVIQYGKLKFMKHDYINSMTSYVYGTYVINVWFDQHHDELCIIAFDPKFKEVQSKCKLSEMTKTKFIKEFVNVIKQNEGRFGKLKEHIFGPKPVVTSRVALEEQSLDLLESDHIVGKGIELIKTPKSSTGRLEFDLIVKPYRLKLTCAPSSSFFQISRDYNSKAIRLDLTDRIGSLRTIKETALELVQQEKQHKNQVETIKTIWHEKLDRECAKELIVDGVKFVRDTRPLQKPRLNADQNTVHNLSQSNLVKYVATIDNVKYPVYWHTAKETVKMCTVKLDEQGKVKERKSGTYNQSRSTIGQSVTVLKGVQGSDSPIDILKAAVKVLKRRKVL